MNKLRRFSDPVTRHSLPAADCKTTFDSNVSIADERVARLLGVLQEIDQNVSGLEELPQSELIELVSNAIMECGFVDGTEARYAIAAVLEAIDAPGSVSASS